MSDKIIKRLQASAENLRLSKEEMLEGRKHLQAMIGAPHAMDALSSARSLKLEPLELATVRTRIVEKMHAARRGFSFTRFATLLSGSMATIFAGGFALAYAAEGALPNDFLYSVKVSVSEPIIELFQRTPEERANWAVKRFERRMGEADTLAERKQLERDITLRMATSIQQARTDAEKKTTDVAGEQAKFILQHRMNAVTSAQERTFRKLVKEGTAAVELSPIIRAANGEEVDAAADWKSSQHSSEKSQWHEVPRPGPSKDRDARQVLDKIQSSFRKAEEKSSHNSSTATDSSSSQSDMPHTDKRMVPDLPDPLKL